MTKPLRVPLEDLREGEIDLPLDAARYVTRVHRLIEGRKILAFDPERVVEADGEVLVASGGACRVRLGVVREALRPSRELVLLQGTGKGDKLDAIVRDATELGVTLVAPVITMRSVSKPAEARAERWRRIAVEAARQSGRGDAPRVLAPTTLLAALAALPVGAEGAGFCLDPSATEPLGPSLQRALSGPGAVSFVVGPEGGLDPQELEAAERAGYRRVSLGPRVLRTETVCAAVLGAAVVLEPSSAS